MAFKVIVHIHNEDPFAAEVEEIPDPKDNFVVLLNPRRRDGKALTFITDGATSFIYPWSRISFLEIMDETSGGANMGIVGFFREDGRAGRP